MPLALNVLEGLARYSSSLILVMAYSKTACHAVKVLHLKQLQGARYILVAFMLMPITVERLLLGKLQITNRSSIPTKFYFFP